MLWNKQKQTGELPLAQKMKKRLFFQLGLPFGVFVTAVLLLLISAVYFVQERSNTSAQIVPQAHAESIALRIEQAIEHSVAVSSMLARLSGSAIDARNLEIVHTLIDSDPAILSVSYDDAHLNMLWSIQTNAGSPPEVMPMLSLPTTVHFEKAVVGKSGYMEQTIHFPVYGQSGEQIGVLMVTYDLSVYWEILADYAYGDAYIVDNRGTVLLSRRSNGESTSTISAILGVRNFINHKRVVSEYTEEDGVTMLSAWAPVRLPGWGVVVEEPVAALYGQLRAMYAFIGFLVFIVVFLFVNEAVIVKRKIFTPLETLVTNAQRIAGGELDAWAPTSANNEFDTVGEAMNSMSRSVRMLRQGLEEKIAERTEHLKTKTEEAERLNAFMVNRELRMRELKEKNTQLENELEACRANTFKMNVTDGKASDR